MQRRGRWDGLLLAGRELSRATTTAQSRTIILLTDGEATEGPNPINVATVLKRQGIQLDIIGIGGSPWEINEAALKQMASVINGELRYWFIKSVPSLIQTFETLAFREIK